ncbi:telethonin-like [Leucoraja erinacea]|uniref:telethonin-like n=1 Tax=Leucoraja erinaceus TaxID=7782 RepID=UPI0024563128|nr:telethonin-like [Leucoraja erinacea]
MYEINFLNKYITIPIQDDFHHTRCPKLPLECDGNVTNSTASSQRGFNSAQNSGGKVLKGEASGQRSDRTPRLTERTRVSAGNKMKLSPDATLIASVREEDARRREFYAAEWDDLILKTRPHDRWSAAERNGCRGESYARKGQVSYLLQRGPDLRLRTGLLGRELTEYHLPLPIFTPAQVGAGTEWSEAEREWERSQSPSGVCPNKKEISAITRELPPLMQPASLGKKPDMARRSLSRSMSQEAQRG